MGLRVVNGIEGVRARFVERVALDAEAEDGEGVKLPQGPPEAPAVAGRPEVRHESLDVLEGALANEVTQKPARIPKVRVFGLDALVVEVFLVSSEEMNLRLFAQSAITRLAL